MTATMPTKPTRDAPMAMTICIPVLAPSDRASMTLPSPLLSILTPPISLGVSTWGQMILETRMEPMGTIAEAISRWSIRMPREV